MGPSIAAGTGYTWLTWLDVTGATSYNIYRQPAGGALAYYDSSDFAGYYDSGATDGVTYGYVITAVGTGGESLYSDPEVYATPLDAPVIATATAASNTEIDIAWGAVTGATGYLLQVSPDGYDTWTTLATQTGLTYPHTGLVAGTTYYYQVSALGTNSQSDPSLVVGATTTGTAASAPAQPTGLTATAGNTLIDLAWPGEYGAVTYNLHRSLTPGAEGTTPYMPGLTSPLFEDGGLTNGTPCYYTVTAVNAAGESVQSTEAWATPTRLLGH